MTDVKVAIVGKTTMIVSDGEDHKRRICIRASSAVIPEPVGLIVSQPLGGAPMLIHERPRPQ